MTSQKKHTADVLELPRRNCNTFRKRQDEFREAVRLVEALPDDAAAVAGIFIAVKPDGNVRTRVVNIEQPHVKNLMESLYELRHKVIEFCAGTSDKCPDPACLARAACCKYSE
jgi:hypothetical protein